MNKEIKGKWIHALRSGEYEQGRKGLMDVEFDTPRYCCLGVLCDLAVKGGMIPPANVDSEEDYLGRFGEAIEAEYLPWEVKEWVGGIAVEDETALTIMNDTGMTFDKIADYIEENL